jgi:hypothetical protein
LKTELLHRKDIDTTKWDEVIACSRVETLYPYSWYLDAAAGRWSALVMDDYRYVMPLVWRRKFGIRYLYQPFYTQQLGVFSKEYVDPTIITMMVSWVVDRYRFASINFNTGNMVGEIAPCRVQDRTNYVLNLGDKYELLQGDYSTNCRRNIKKARKISNRLEKETTCEELVAFKRENDVVRRTAAQYRWLVELLNIVKGKGSGMIYSARDEGRLSAAAFFGFSRTRAIYLVSASSEQGRENRSMFRLVDSFIMEHAGSGLLLDFEGSNIPDVARFFSGFGAYPETYQNLSFSRLPLLQKRFVKDV